MKKKVIQEVYPKSSFRKGEVIDAANLSTTQIFNTLEYHQCFSLVGQYDEVEKQCLTK